MVHIRALGGGVLDGGKTQFAMLPAQRDQRDSVREKPGRAAFVGGDVGVLMTEHAFVGSTRRGDRQGIGGRPIENKKDLAVCFEDLADEPRGFRRPRVRPIGRCMARVGLLHRRPNLRADSCKVVAGKLAAGRGGVRRRGGGNVTHKDSLVRGSGEYHSKNPPEKIDWPARDLLVKRKCGNTAAEKMLLIFPPETAAS
jgi:hypothetical protein